MKMPWSRDPDDFDILPGYDPNMFDPEDLNPIDGAGHTPLPGRSNPHDGRRQSIDVGAGRELFNVRLINTVTGDETIGTVRADYYRVVEGELIFRLEKIGNSYPRMVHHVARGAWLDVWPT